MFVPLDQLLAAGDDAAAACEQLRAAAAAMQGGGTHAYAHPLGGSCPLTGACMSNAACAGHPLTQQTNRLLIKHIGLSL
jgi:hypothetical protein